jgi:hypothetical protein
MGATYSLLFAGHNLFEMQFSFLKTSLCLAICLGLFSAHTQAQWTITADDIDSDNYYGITVANGMVGAGL